METFFLFHDNDFLYNVNQIGQLCNFNNLCIADGLNVFLIENTNQIIWEAEIRGNKCWVHVNNLDASVPVIIHEIGHCFGLFHTSDRPETFATNVNNMTKTWQCDEQGNLGPTYFHESFTDCEGVSLTFLWEIENVNGENSHVSGDYVRDTPSDINISSGCVPDPYQNCTTVSNACSKKLNPKSRRDPNCQILKPNWFNFMRRTIKPECLDHFTVGQVSRMHGVIYQYLSHLLLNEIPDYFTPCTHCFAGDDNPCYICTEIPTQDIIINQNTIFQQNQIHGTLVIKAGSVLIINNEIELTPYSQIIIEAGGKLIIDGGKLTKCSGVNKWKGIKAWGNPFFGQSHAVEMKNGAVIEYAEIVINTSNPVYGGIFGYFDLSGAKITVENSTIRNCDVGVNFGPFGYSGPYYVWEDDSYIKNSFFSDCLFGIRLKSNLGVEINNTDFTGNSIQCIESTNSMINVSGCNFEGYSGILLEAIWPSLEGSVITENNFFNITEGVLIGTQGNATEHSIRGNFFGSSTGVIGYGQSFFNIQSNDFGGGAGVFSWYSGDDYNLVSDNGFDGNDYGASAWGRNNVEYLANCFNNIGTVNIEIYDNASIHPTQGYEDLTASNCFTKQVPTFLTGAGSEYFTYFIKTGTVPQSCKHPGFAGNFGIDYSLQEYFLTCGTGVWGSLPPKYRNCVIPGTLSERKQMEQSLKAEIAGLKNDATISPLLKKWLIARYERCLKKLIGLIALQIVKNTGDGREQAVTYLTNQELFSHKIMAYALIAESGDYARAENYLTSLPTSNTGESDFVVAQNLYLDFLTEGKDFELTSQQRSALEGMAKAENEWSGFARTIYYLITGQRIKIDLPHLIPVTPRSRNISSSESIEIQSYPNPVFNNEHVVLISTENINSKLMINVKDAMGQKVISKVGHVGENILDFENSNAGLFFLEVVSEGRPVFINKVIKL
jgi:hypothetical protein